MCRLSYRPLALEVVSSSPDSIVFCIFFAHYKFPHACVYLSLLDLNSGDHTDVHVDL